MAAGKEVAREEEEMGEAREVGSEVVMEAVVTVVAVTAAARGVDLAERRCCLCRRPSCCRSRLQTSTRCCQSPWPGSWQRSGSSCTQHIAKCQWAVCGLSVFDSGTWHVCVEARNLLSETWIVDELEHERRRSHRIVARTVGVEIVRDAGVLPVR